MIGLVDGNNFYVSCERIFDHNDGCVISRSQECKDLGIPMGTPFFQLKPRLAQCGLILKSSNYELYGDISRRVIATLGEFAPEVEQYSIDEAFIHVNPPSGTDMFEYGTRIRRAVLKWVGIPSASGLRRVKRWRKSRIISGKSVLPEFSSCRTIRGRCWKRCRSGKSGA